MRGSVACQTIGRSARAKAALTGRSHNAVTESAPVSDASRRVLTETKMLHGVVRLPGLESIPDAWCRELYAERSLTIRAQHEEACACMDKDTHSPFVAQSSGGADLREDLA